MIDPAIELDRQSDDGYIYAKPLLTHYEPLSRRSSGYGWRIVDCLR